MEKSFPFNSINRDRLYSADDWRSYFATLIGNGVFPNPSTGLHIISNNNMTISILEGKGYINGAIYHNTDNLILPIDPADGTLNRIDRIVMRFDTLDRIIKCKVKKGTFATNPVAPTLQRDADAYELCIAEIRIDRGITSIQQSKITDTRLNSELCGIVTQTVKTIDTTTLFKKLEAYIDERGQDVEGWIDEATTRWEVEFISWFNTIKDILDGDVAGALANRILQLENVVNNLELTSTKVMRPGGKTVEASILANETSIQSHGREIEDLKQSVSSGKSVVANAITDKGVPTLATDSFNTMAGNISEIREIDIITADELPTTVKAGRYVILTTYSVNKIYFQKNTDNLIDGDIVLITSKNGNELNIVNTNSILLKLSILSAFQKKGNDIIPLDVYFGDFSLGWVKAISKSIYYIEDGIEINPSITEGFSVTYGSSEGELFIPGMLSIYTQDNYSYLKTVDVSSGKTVNTRHYNKLYFNINRVKIDIGSGEVKIGLVNEKSSNNFVVCKTFISSNSASIEELDISNIDGDYYIFIYAYKPADQSMSGISITDIYMQNH